MNTVSILGRVARDPELKRFESGAVVARFSIAVEKQMTKEQKAKAEKAGEPTADFFSVSSWGNQAEKFVMPYLKKGARVVITGRLTTNSFVGKEGNKVSSVEIVASDLDIIDYPDRNSNTEKQGNKVSGGLLGY